MVSAEEIADGLTQLGLGRSSSVIVHSSFRELVLADPAALLCSTPGCRCVAAHEQRLVAER